jgi:hypothetical protein
LSKTIDIGLLLHNHQLLDSEDRRCGKVDDLALEGGPGEPLEIVAILAERGKVRVPWEEVDQVSVHVRLRKTAPELGLGRGDDRLRLWLEKIPGADR